MSSHLLFLVVVVATIVIAGLTTSTSGSGSEIADEYKTLTDSWSCWPGYTGTLPSAIKKGVKACKKKDEIGNLNCFLSCVFQEGEIVEDGKVDQATIKDIIGEWFEDGSGSAKHWIEATKKCLSQFRQADGKFTKMWHGECEDMTMLVLCIKETRSCDNVKQHGPSGGLVTNLLGGLLG